MSYNLNKQESPRAQYLIAALLLMLLVVWSILTRGRLEEDEALHFLIARYAWTDWRLLLDVWGRPGYTIPASLFAVLGTYDAMRFFSLLITWIAALGAWRGAALLQLPHSWLAAVFFLASPTVLQSSAGAFTEPVFAAALIWGLVFYQEGRFHLSALALGWTAVTRLEGVLMLPLYGILFLAKRQWISMLLSGLPFGLWVLISGALSGDLLWVKNSVPYRIKQYGNETDYFPGYFLFRLVQLMGPPLAVAAILGSIFLARVKGALPWLATAWFYFAIQEGAYAADYGSAGYTRFLIGAAPAFALFALAALNVATGDIPSRLAPPLRIAGVVLAFAGAFWSLGKPSSALFITAFFLVLVLVAWLLRERPASPAWFSAIPLLLAAALYPAAFARPVQMTPYDRAIRRAVKASMPYMEAAPVFMSGNYQSVERLGINPYDKDQFLLASPGNLHHAPQGTIFIWDGFFTARLHHVHREDIEGTGYFEVILEVSEIPGAPPVIAYRKMVPPPPS